MKIPLVDLQRQYCKYQQEFEEALLGSARSCQFILGEALHRFEKKFAAYLGVKHVIGVGSGTDALTLILKALGCGPGDLVLTQDNTFIATTLAVENVGADVALTDVAEDTGAMDVETYGGLSPKIVIPVHLYGFPCDLAPITEKFGPGSGDCGRCLPGTRQQFCR